MKKELVNILTNMKKYNAGSMVSECFGFRTDVEYDALVLAPGWKPTKIIKDDTFRVTTLAQHSYFSGYLVEKDGLKIAWAQTASGACNLLDHGIICGDLHFKKMIFIGAVGSLVSKFDVGDFCTPDHCISGVYANNYLKEKLTEYTPFEAVYPDADFVDTVINLAENNRYEMKKAKVFCTDSIALEYSHLDEIKATGAELIEMETSTFYKLADLLEVPAIALLIVSDNSATGKPLLGRSKALDRKYNFARCHIIPDMIYKIAKTGNTYGQTTEGIENRI